MVDQQEYNRRLIEEFRATHKISDGPLAGKPLLLLTTIGAKSGQRRTTPLMYIPHAEGLLVIASNAGARNDPDWYHNLVAHPEVIVEVGSETFDASAVVVGEAEYALLWAWIAERYPFFVEHQAKTTRQIPIIILKRR